jgi:putative Ca2+/H+ antiporter (TMEM165/GDT1 family)
MRSYVVIFFSVLLAEIGDKTQLSTMLFATDRSISKAGVFMAAGLALLVSTLIAVLAGDLITRFVPASRLKIFAGIGFIVIGLWTVFTASR